MQWELYFEGLQSLWDAETENAELDERRELIRADRATQPLVAVLCERARRTPLVAGVDGLGNSVHLTRLGSKWLEGVACGTDLAVIAPLSSLQWVGEVDACGCSVSVARLLQHVTFGARLRALERSGAVVSVVLRNGGYNGRIVAVWRDAFDLLWRRQTLTVNAASVLALTLNRS